jgi:hypothetical protein
MRRSVKNNPTRNLSTECIVMVHLKVPFWRGTEAGEENAEQLQAVAGAEEGM